MNNFLSKRIYYLVMSPFRLSQAFRDLAVKIFNLAYFPRAHLKGVIKITKRNNSVASKASLKKMKKQNQNKQTNKQAKIKQ